MANCKSSDHVKWPLPQAWWLTVRRVKLHRSFGPIISIVASGFSHQTHKASFLLVLQLQSCVELFATPQTSPCQASLSFTISWSSLRLMSIESVMPSNHLILCCPHLLSSIFPSIKVFSNELALCIRWPKYWSFILISVLSMNIHSWFPLGLIGLISLQSKGFLRVFSSTTIQTHRSWALSLLYVFFNV